MEEELELILGAAEESMDKALEHLDYELGKIRAGKANPHVLDDVKVEYFGAPTPLNQVANVSVPDPRTIAVKPWEKSMIGPIEKAIMAANLGLNPDNNGEMIRIMIPPLTEERRRDLAKMAKRTCEDTKIAIRNIRRDAIEDLKKLKKDGLGEDLQKDKEGEIQKLHDVHVKKVDEMYAAKEKDIMTV
ncbi:MAG: ribosome recycling factor [Marinilabiliaceae bacterium]|nr:ribosome recycling factor [Bacteroidales bacterium]MDD5816558.1 ribosome recycling factor [Bacteroidales bacterium]MDY4520123.1 ribosome recycling factor [Bacteroidales bacterium]